MYVSVHIELQQNIVDYIGMLQYTQTLHYYGTNEAVLSVVEYSFGHS